MLKLSNIAVKYRWPILIAVALLTVFFGYQLQFIKVDSNVVNSLPKDDPVVSLFNEVGKQFGGNQMGIVILEAENVLDPEILDEIQEVTDTLSEMEGILSVTSLTNMMNINVEGDNFEVGNLINSQNRPKTREEAEKLKPVITSNELVAGTIISKDATATTIIFTFEDGVDAEKVSQVIMDKIDKMHLSAKHYFAGSSFMTQYVADVISHDLVTLIPISFFLIAFILYLSFYSIRGIVLPLLTAGLAIIWAMGIFAMAGLNLSMVSNNVPIIILAVGTAYAIHVLNRVNQCEEKDVKTAVAKALSFMILPVSLTALTTMTGFLSFIFGAYLKMIRDFGLLAAMGTFFAAVLALSFVPALLAVLPPAKMRAGKLFSGKKATLLTDRFLVPVTRLVLKHRIRIIVVWIVLFLVSIFGIFMIKRSVSVSNYFKAHHPVSIAERIMTEKFGGTKPVFIVFKGDMQSPEVLKRMRATEAYMKKSQYISSTQSIADIVAKLNKAMGGENKIPDDAATIGQLWFLIGQQESINRLVTPDLDQGIIIAKYIDVADNHVKKFEQYMTSYFNEHKSDDYTIEMTGMPFVNAQLDRSLLHSQMASLIIAVLLVVALVSLMFLSIREGLIGSLPIIATIGILYGLMGWTGIPLNIVTVLVASIAMGIGIDYSIHFLSHFNHSVKIYNSVESAVEETILVSGKAIMINFISVSAGFLVLVFSSLVPMIYFGILIALSMLGSSMGALTLLPSIILISRKKETDENTEN